MNLQRKKEPVLTIKNRIQMSKKCAFSKWLTHAFGQKSLFSPYLDLIKKRLEIMLFDFAEKKTLF